MNFAEIMQQIPDDLLKAEYMRRHNLRVSRDNVGRKPKLRKCKLCGEKFGTNDMRSHTPQCRKEHAQ